MFTAPYTIDITKVLSADANTIELEVQLERCETVYEKKQKSWSIYEKKQ